jgi:predicted ATPase
VLRRLPGAGEDVAEIAALLDEFGLVTVTGPGVVGKTRLAVEVARQYSAVTGGQRRPRAR